jgi:hypothetical protein
VALIDSFGILPVVDVGPLHAFTGTYGDYRLGQVSRVFPQLRQQVLTDEAP